MTDFRELAMPVMQEAITSPLVVYCKVLARAKKLVLKSTNSDRYECSAVAPSVPAWYFVMLIRYWHDSCEILSSGS